MTLDDYLQLTHSLNKSVGEWEIKIEDEFFSSYTNYKLITLFLLSFPRAKFKSSTLELVNFERNVKNIFLVQEIEFNQKISFSTTELNYQLHWIDNKELKDSWVNGAISLEIYNEPNQKNHPFVCLRVYPNLFHDRITLSNKIIPFQSAANQNKKRFNRGLKNFVRLSNGKISASGSELGYKITDLGIK